MNTMGFLEFDEYKRNGSGRTIELANGSDYSGGVVTKANYDVLCARINDRFPHTESFIDLRGMYGSYGIGVLEDNLSEEEIDWLEEIEDALEDYPFLDDERSYQTEVKVLTEFFNDEVASELGMYLGLSNYVAVVIDKGNIEWLWSKVMEEYHGFIESGIQPYIDWDGLFDSCEREDLLNLLVKEPLTTSHPQTTGRFPN